MSATRAKPISRQRLLLLLTAILLFALCIPAGKARAQTPKLPTQGPGPTAQPSTTQGSTTSTPAKKAVRRTPINWKLWGGIPAGVVVVIILIVAVAQKQKKGEQAA